MAAEHRPDLLGGVTVITGKAQRLRDGGAAEPVALTAIPYYAWDHRDPGEMAVWLIEQPAACGPTQTAAWVGSNYTPAYCVNQVQMWHNRMHPSADQTAGLRLEVTDPAAPVLSGAVGLRTFNTAASFDNVIVLPLDALPSTRPQ